MAHNPQLSLSPICCVNVAIMSLAETLDFVYKVS